MRVNIFCAGPVVVIKQIALAVAIIVVVCFIACCQSNFDLVVYSCENAVYQLIISAFIYKNPNRSAHVESKAWEN